jgi:hypothetical protein
MKIWNSKTILLFFELKNLKKFTLEKLWMFLSVNDSFLSYFFRITFLKLYEFIWYSFAKLSRCVGFKHLKLKIGSKWIFNVNFLIFVLWKENKTCQDCHGFK